MRNNVSGGRSFVYRATRASCLIGLIFAAQISLAQQEQSSAAKSLVIEFDSPALASRGAADVTLQEVVAFLELNVDAEDRFAFLRSDERLRQVLRDMLRTRAVATEALEEDYLADPLAAAEAYDAAMNFLARKQLDAVGARSELADYEQQARERYLRDPEQFREPPEYSFTHLLITEDQQERNVQEVLAEVQEQLSQGVPFPDLIAKYSEDPSVPRNKGSFKDVSAENLDETFLEAIESLEPRTISAPVQTRFGWHLIRVDSVTPSRIPPFDEVASRLLTMERNDHLETIKQNYMESLINAPLEVNETVLAELREMYAP